MALPAAVGGFSLIPVDYSSSTTHYIYARRHSGSKKAAKQSVPNGRTLFLVNVPPDATERELILLFNHCGTIERVVFDLDTAHDEGSSSDNDDDDDDDESTEEVEDQQPRKRRRTTTSKPKVISLPHQSTPTRTFRTTGRTCYLVFLDASSVDRALSSPGSKVWASSTAEAPCGISHYVSLYDSLRPPLDAIREHADSSMEVYEYELRDKSKQQSKYRRGEAIVDEDGFTLVTRGGVYGKTLGGEVGVASKKFQFQEGRHRKKKKKVDDDEKAGLYGFQKAEKQRKELMDLKKKWEEDKAKIEKLKASRTFKPY